MLFGYLFLLIIIYREILVHLPTNGKTLNNTKSFCLCINLTIIILLINLKSRYLSVLYINRIFTVSPGNVEQYYKITYMSVSLSTSTSTTFDCTMNTIQINK